MISLEALNLSSSINVFFTLEEFLYACVLYKCQSAI